jgi:predicted Rdx family selenoprotein
MKITIETSDLERVALQPENQPLLRQSIGGGAAGIEALDGGAPSAELLQSLRERTDPQSASMRVGADDAYSSMIMSGGEPSSLSRH